MFDQLRIVALIGSAQSEVEMVGVVSEVRWYIEFENGGRSTAYDTKVQAEAALPEYRSHRALMSPRYSKPVRIVSSDGQKFDIPSG